MTMRDPDGDLKFYNESVEEYAKNLLRPFVEKDPCEKLRKSLYFENLRNVAESLRFRYGRGDSLTEIQEFFDKEGWPFYQKSIAALSESVTPSGEPYPNFHDITIYEYAPWEVLTLMAFFICKNPSAEHLLNHQLWLDADEPCRMIDVLMKAFVPDYPYRADYKYKSTQFRDTWMTPLLSALAQPAEKRDAAVAEHMGNWHRLMRQQGWKPKRAPTDSLWCHFAFEVALAVCAYDIDDSSFKDHPHYPRDLVEHYRQHLRHTRDAWRPIGVGAGIELPPPTPPKRVDLARSKRKNFARWIELVCDGYDDAVESVLEATGKPRKVQDLYALLDALQEAGHVIHADFKDDSTLAAQAEELAHARGIGPFESPDEPPQGAARSTATLRALDAWATPRGYALLDVDGQDDAYHAVLVKSEYCAELLALGKGLGLHIRHAAGVYQD